MRLVIYACKHSFHSCSYHVCCQCSFVCSVGITGYLPVLGCSGWSRVVRRDKTVFMSAWPIFVSLIFHNVALQVSEVTCRYDVDKTFIGSNVKYGTIIDSWQTFWDARIKYCNSLLCSIYGNLDTFTIYFTVFCRFSTAKRKGIYQVKSIKVKAFLY